MQQGDRPQTTITLTIANGAQQTAAFDKQHYTLMAIEFPAAMTGTAVKFLGAATGAGTYKYITDQAGVDLSVTVAADNILGLDDALPELSPVRFMKLESGTVEGAARTLILHLGV